MAMEILVEDVILVVAVEFLVEEEVLLVVTEDFGHRSRFGGRGEDFGQRGNRDRNLAIRYEDLLQLSQFRYLGSIS